VIGSAAIAQAVCALLAARRWYVRDLAVRLGVSPATVSRWCNGATPRPPHLAALIRIGLVLPARQQPCLMRRAA
jgi:transcriptional regulator with XRE-family HTH domain